MFGTQVYLPDDINNVILGYTDDVSASFISMCSKGHQSRLKNPLNRETLCESLAFYGFCELLEHSIKLGYNCDENSCIAAVQGNHLDCLKILFKHGIPISNFTGYAAIESNNLKCLEYSWENGYVISARSWNIAAYKGHLKCLVFLNEHSDGSKSQALYSAATNNHLECIKFLHEDVGMSLHGNHLAFIAANNGYLEIIKYLYEKGCSFDKRIYQITLRYGYLKCSEYIKENVIKNT